MIIIKTQKELQIMREGGQILHRVLAELVKAVEPGRNELELDALARDLAKKYGATCSTMGYHGFPAHVCISVNDEVVHGIPKDSIFQEGDIVGIDFCITYQGLVTDSAVTVPVGKVPEKTAQFLDHTRTTLEGVIPLVKKGIRVGDISSFIQERAERAGYHPVEELTGHGVGRDMHEDPYVPNVGRKGTGPILEAGMTLAIEPILSLGSPAVRTDPDGWTIRTRDGSLACQFEHTVIVHEDYAEIIT